MTLYELQTLFSLVLYEKIAFGEDWEGSGCGGLLGYFATLSTSRLYSYIAEYERRGQGKPRSNPQLG
jgi:hypothetical protein